MIRTKTIGRLPQNYGDYDSSKMYGKKQRCFLYGCEWESKMEGNTYAPATLNTTTGVITPDTAHWIHCSGSYNDWLIDNGYKKVDAENVKDGNSTQHEINDALAQSIADEIQRAQNAENDRYTKSEVYTKTEVNSLITTPDQGFVSVTATSSTTSATDVLPATGEPDTIYRVGNWDGTQYDTSCYTEYAWSSEDTTYIKLSTKQVGIDDEPTAESDNLVKSGGVSDFFNNKVSPNNGTWKSVVNHCWVRNWTGGDKRLRLQFGYRNDPSYGSGIALYMTDADFSNPIQCAYWYSYHHAGYNAGGTEILDFIPIVANNINYGEVSLEINWDAIPSVFNNLFEPYYYLNIEYYNPIPEENKNNIAIIKSEIQEHDTIVWSLANDTYSNFYAYPKIAQYTKPFEDTISFDRVILRGIRYSYGAQINYRIYVVPKKYSTSANRYAPAGSINSSFRLLKSGVLSISSANYKDYYFDFSEPVVCNQGEQVVVYLQSDGWIMMRGIDNGDGNTDRTSNPALICTADNPWSDNWVIASFDESTNHGYFNIALNLESRQIFALNKKKELALTLPSVVYGVVGTQIYLFDDNMSYPVDKGLKSPINYEMSYFGSGIGDNVERRDRGLCFTPSEAMEKTVDVRLYDNVYHELQSQKYVNFHVVGKNAISSAKNIIHFGDSLGLETTIELYNNFHDANKFTGTIPTIWGSKEYNGIKYEATGGWKWSNYATNAEGNPLWNTAEGKIDIAYYRNNIGFSGKFDAVSFQLGVNDSYDGVSVETIKSYITALYNAFIADNANCLFIIGLTTMAGNTNDSAANGAFESKQRIYKYKLLYNELIETGAFPNLRLATTGIQIDRYYGFGFAERQISQRYTEMEKYHNNFVHPVTSGYGQIADALFACYCNILAD